MCESCVIYIYIFFVVVCFLPLSRDWLYFVTITFVFLPLRAFLIITNTRFVTFFFFIFVYPSLLLENSFRSRWLRRRSRVSVCLRNVYTSYLELLPFHSLTFSSGRSRTNFEPRHGFTRRASSSLITHIYLFTSLIRFTCSSFTLLYLGF